jgi:hypothetical protein
MGNNVVCEIWLPCSAPADASNFADTVCGICQVTPNAGRIAFVGLLAAARQFDDDLVLRKTACLRVSSEDEVVNAIDSSLVAATCTSAATNVEHALVMARGL